MWLAHNRSIECLNIHNIDLLGMDISKLNSNLWCIEITYSKICVGIQSLISVLSQNQRWFIWSGSIFTAHGQAGGLINALNLMSGLHNLFELDLGRKDIGIMGCVALCTLLRNPECRLRTLNLTHNCLDIECMCTLISGLSQNNSLNTLAGKFYWLFIESTLLFREDGSFRWRDWGWLCCCPWRFYGCQPNHEISLC